MSPPTNNFYRYVQIHNYNKRRYLVECTRFISVITSTDTFKFIIIINVGIWLSVHDSFLLNQIPTFIIIMNLNVSVEVITEMISCALNQIPTLVEYTRLCNNFYRSQSNNWKVK
jgi:hypothetical protein